MKAIAFRVQNFRNIDDSGWIPLERVTAFVGRNESGKTTLLRALHKFNAASGEKYDALKEFPRDRFTREYKSASLWPVCSIEFEIAESIRRKIADVIGTTPPNTAIVTRFYESDDFDVRFQPELYPATLEPSQLLDAIRDVAKAARRFKIADDGSRESTERTRTALIEWAAMAERNVNGLPGLRSPDAIAVLSALRTEVDKHSTEISADCIERFLDVLQPVLAEAQRPLPAESAKPLIIEALPVFVYFENYGILDSAIYLPRFLEEERAKPHDPRLRTISAMFKHVGLSPKEIAELGEEQASNQRRAGQAPSPDSLKRDHEQKERRAVMLNSASIDISRRFSDWWQQRRHKIEYHADGAYFRIWVSDDRRPDVRIELESRSKGFQWFFSFYLVFLVESEEGHKDAVLLLDEPGLHLHPTAQQELIGFFENLSQKNQLLYSTHSPFLIDGEHLHRVRPVTEGEDGRSRVSVDSWPADRDTIFPLQAAAGYAMVKGLFANRKTVLVEGIADYYYLHALSQQCRDAGRRSLPEDVYVVPCGGTKLVGHIASLFLGQRVRPVVLLDGDDAARARRDQLLKELYAGHSSAVLLLDELFSGAEVEIEDLIGEDEWMPGVRAALGQTLVIGAEDRSAGGVVSQLKAATTRLGIALPDGWKATAAAWLVAKWAGESRRLPDELLERGQRLFDALALRFPT